MKLTFIILIFNFSIILSMFAYSKDSISTEYKNGEFITYCQVWVNASDSNCIKTAKEFDHQMKYNLEALFNWALKGLNLRKEKKEIMMFYFKSTSYNEKTNVINCLGDAIVPGIITFPNITVQSQLSSRISANGRNGFYLSLINASGLIKTMNTSFTIISTRNNGSWYTLETHVRFGWFFNIFITQTRYKSIMEGRLKRFIHNLKEESERKNQLSDNKNKAIKNIN